VGYDALEVRIRDLEQAEEQRKSLAPSIINALVVMAMIFGTVYLNYRYPSPTVVACRAHNATWKYFVGCVKNDALVPLQQLENLERTR
jgi:hypothetical protein